MLQVFRESVGRYVAIAILALIGVTFVFFGIDFSITQISYAAKVNGEPIAIREFEEALQRRQNDFQQQYRIELTDELRLALRQEVLEGMILREVLLQHAHDEGYRVSDARIEASILNEPAFQVGGQYSEDVAISLLQSQGLTVDGYKRSQREQLTLVEFQAGVVNSSFITPAEFRRYIEVYFEKREIGYAVFPITSFVDQVTIEDAAIAEFYAANPARFETAESVDVEFVVLDLERIAAGIEITEEELLEYYSSESERYAGSEERHVRHILIAAEDGDTEAARAGAARVRERLDAGEDFAALAAELSDDAGTRNAGGDLGWYVRGVLSGPLDDALFSMAVGAIEGPVESEFGFHVLRLEEVRAGAQPPFESVREEIRADLARQNAYSEYFDRATDLAEAAFDNGGDLASVAALFGLPLETMSGLTRSGGGDRFADPSIFVAAAFSEDAIASGLSTDLIELSDTSAAILRVTGHHLPEPKPLEEVAAEIRQGLLDEGATELAAEAAAAFMSSIDVAAVAAGTEDPAALAAMQGATWTGPLSVERGGATAPSAIVSAVFAQSRPSPGAVGIARAALDNGDEAVVLTFSATPGNPEDIPSQDRDLGQRQLVEQLAEAEMNAFADQVRSTAKVRVPDQILNPDL